MASNESEEAGDLSVWVWFWRGAVAVLLLTIGYWAALGQLYTTGSDRGQFGDMFGGLNTVFSGLAFLGLVLAIVLQKNELGEQRKELKLARAAHESTAQAMEIQIRNAEKVAKVGGLNLLITIERERLATSASPGTVGEVERHRRTLRKLKDLEQQLEMLVRTENTTGV